MTEEQIQQNAEAYSNGIDGSMCYPAINDTAYNAYIAGAHSRDVEIGTLEGLLKINEHEIEQLRNPWISVEKRLPELSKKEGSFSSEAVLVRIKSEKGHIYYAVAVYYPRSKYWCIRNEQDKVTHWMPIPEY